MSWIKCTECMPVEDWHGSDAVLVCVIYSDGSGRSELFGCFVNGVFVDENGYRKMDDEEVWYWQPFPEAPTQ